MIAVESFLIYLGAWCRAFSPSAQRDAPLGIRRLAFLILIPLFLVLIAVNWVFMVLDRVFYARFCSAEVQRPVFVLGVPRSGTTYLHRKLAEDAAFSTTATWEVFVAPAILQKKLAHLLAGLDQALGSPLWRTLSAVIESTTRQVNDVHPVGLLEAEEDYLLMLSAAGCFLMSLAFPASDNLKNLGHLSSLSAKRQRRLLDHYHRLIQRQLYQHPGQLLSKNAAFASWAQSLATRYPDALFILCIRSPENALASQVNSLAGARSAFATFPNNARLESEFADHYTAWLEQLAELAVTSSADTIVVEQEWMKNHPETVLSLIYQRLHRSPPQISAAHANSENTATPCSIGGQTGFETTKRPSDRNYQLLQQIAVKQRSLLDDVRRPPCLVNSTP